MNAVAEPTLPVVLEEPAPTPPPARPPRWKRIVIGAAKFVAGVFCCQAMLPSLLVVGCTQQRMRRKVLQRWGVADPAAPQRGWLRAGYATAKRGTAAALNVLLLTLPATGLWYVAWVLGWNVSFHKQYEQSSLGASLGMTGIALFAVAMLYLPIALARQAVTGQSRAFWRVAENWRLARHAAPRLLPWAIVFALSAGGLMLLRIYPYFFAGSEAGSALSDNELRQWANQYYLRVAIVLLPAYVLLWGSAAQTYAAAVVRAARDGFDRSRLLPIERDAVDRLAPLASLPHPSDRGLLGRWLGRLGVAAAMGFALVVWSGVAVQVFVAQFFYYVPAQGWLNQPLVLLPWMRYLPPGLGG